MTNQPGCTNKWDYTAPTEGRHPKFPDTTVRMQWNHRGRSWMDVDCSYHECLPPDPPPESVVGQRCERRWTDLSCNYGTERMWFTNYAGQVQGGDPMSYFALFPIPRERCVPFIGEELVLDGRFLVPPTDFTVRRSAWTDVRLTVGQSTWPKPLRSVVVRLTAVDKTDGQSLGAGDTGCGSNEPNNHWLGREIDPVTQRYEVNGRPVDAEGRVLLQVPRGTRNYKLRPQIGCQWYQFEALAESPQVVRMTWSRHPECSPVNPQAKFDAGAAALARDDDSLVKNPTDPLDDVTVFVEFILFQGRDPVFPGSFARTNFNNIRTPVDANSLLAATFANVKVVTSIWVEVGQGNWVPLTGLSKTNVPTIVIVADAGNFVPVHEWGHTVGLEDRYDSADALMWYHELSGSHREINASERGQINWSVWTNADARWGWH